MAGKSARLEAFVLGITAVASMAVSAPAVAQSSSPDAEARLRKLEAEIRALQRQVFPGGGGRYFATEGGPAVPAPTVASDTLTRLDSIEAQIARLTNQVEQNTNSLAQLSARLGMSMPAASQAMPAAGSAVAPTAVPPSSVAPGATGPAAATPTPAATAPATSPALPVSAAAVASAQPPAAPALAAPSPERIAAVKAIPKPSTDDAGDDEYSYGYRLWDAKLYPEAAQQLRKFVEAYPSHWRTSHGMNLLGRAYLDDGKPTDAAPWFLKNYQSNKQGDRAGDSLLYLSRAMITAGDKRRACIALAEFADTYPALATGRLLGEYNDTRRKVVCN